MAASKQHLYQAEVQFDKTIVLPRTLATGSTYGLDANRHVQTMYSCLLCMTNHDYTMCERTTI